MTRSLLALSLALPLASVACFGKDDDDDDDDDWGDADESGDPDRGGDSGGTDGADGGDGFSPAAVSGRMALYMLSDSEVGYWSISGSTVDCGACLFGFEGEFEVEPDSPFGVDFNRRVEWFDDGEGDGYVYTNYGEYWGYGEPNGSGTASWYLYSSSYIYAGFVYY